MAIALLIGLVALLFFVAPAAPRSWRWRVWPVSIIGFFILLVLIMGVLEIVPWWWPAHG
jgi:protein-S-isoprenylcysteine O-methyltransferase Ste14